jgi:hypothetical protein
MPEWLGRFSRGRAVEVEHTILPKNKASTYTERNAISSKENWDNMDAASRFYRVTDRMVSKLALYEL